MSLWIFIILSACSSSYGYNIKRQLGAYHWYDQVVLPTVPSVHQQQLYRQLPESAAVIFTPQYSKLQNEPRSESEQVVTDYRLARVYPVLIHFLSPEQAGNLEAQYQLTLEPVPEYQMMEIRESKYPELDRNEDQPSNETDTNEHLQFGNKVTTARPSYPSTEKKTSLKGSIVNTKEQ